MNFHILKNGKLILTTPLMIEAEKYKEKGFEVVEGNIDWWKHYDGKTEFKKEQEENFEIIKIERRKKNGNAKIFH